MGRRMRVFFAKCRLYFVRKWSQIRGFFARLRLPGWMRSRRALLASYILVMVALAGVWWYNSPYRLGNIANPPPIVTEDPDPGEQPNQTVGEVPEPGEEPDPTGTPADDPELEDSIPVVARPLVIEALKKPVEGPIVMEQGWYFSSTFGDFRWHDGVALGSTQGSPVVAAYAGTVTEIRTEDPEWGTMVTIDHGSNWVTKYANVIKVGVTKGQKVAEGQSLGQVGPNPPVLSGEKSLIYLLFSKDGKSQDPAKYFK